MKKEFIPYEEALALKELGFDEPCFGFYTYKAETRRYTNYDGELNDFQTLKNSKITLGDDWCTIPLYQQAFRWFREKYDLWQDISVFVWDYDKNELGFNVRTYLNPFDVNTEKKTHLEVFETYEEAELECLRKLIQIVKDLAIAK
jgi:hypothetical protein